MACNYYDPIIKNSRVTLQPLQSSAIYHDKIVIYKTDGTYYYARVYTIKKFKRNKAYVTNMEKFSNNPDFLGFTYCKLYKFIDMLNTSNLPVKIIFTCMSKCIADTYIFKIPKKVMKLKENIEIYHHKITYPTLEAVINNSDKQNTIMNIFDTIKIKLRLSKGAQHTIDILDII